MAYKFTGRIKRIGYENKQNFCEFDVDNSIKIDEKEYGVAYQGTELIIVEEFTDITDNIFSLLQNCRDERFEIEYDQNKTDENKPTIIKVTVLR